MQRVGDASRDGHVVAAAGEEVELECIVSGGNPPATARWFAGDRELRSGHTQENSRSSRDPRKWISISRLTLPVNKEDDGAILRCVAEHPALDQPLEANTELTIHCELSFLQTLRKSLLLLLLLR